MTKLTLSHGLKSALSEMPILEERYQRLLQHFIAAGGVAPTTLIDGDKLIDVLIEHGIGVRKPTLEVLAVDADVFADLEGES